MKIFIFIFLKRMWGTIVILLLFILLIGLLFVLYLISRSEGLKAKFCSLLGIRLASLENQRWTFQQYDPNKKSKVLIIAFAGGAMQLMQVPRREFMQSLSTLQCDQLFLMDPSQMWYLKGTKRDWKGFEELNEKLKIISEEYEKVIMIGNCLGATGALLFSSHSNYTIAFNPFVNLDKVHSKIVKFWARKIPRNLRNEIPMMISNSIQNSKGKVYVHIGNDKCDIEQSLYLNSCDNLKIEYHTWSKSKNSSSLPGEMKKKDQLYPLIMNAYQSVIEEININH